jgi:uncharacterized surface protein with fasciclin (FAS1) repeats
MKRILQSTLAIALLILGFTSSAQTRYLDDVFSAVTVTSDIDYATNISILPLLQGLPPGPATLKCDIYEPNGDSVVNRPVIILIHTGTFLPPVANGQPTGSKTDLSIVEQCNRWAKKGYVAVAMENRLGWNPTSSDQDVRTSSLLQAAYRGIQDAKAMVRYMRMTEDNGNPYGINPDKIILGGQGTGGYLSLGYATLNNPGAELMLPKFINFQDPANPIPYVIPQFFGNPDGTDSTYLPDFASPTGQTELWNIPNNPSYSNDVNMVFNLGGALADVSWLQAGEVPMVSFHCENDPNAPIDTGDVVEPVNDDFVIEVMGSRTAQFYANQYLNNDAFALAGISDAFTTAANVNNGGLEGLYVFKTPAPLAGANAYGQNYTEEGAPWDWWDNTSYEAVAQAYNAGSGAPAGYFAADAITGNPDMSAAKGNAYLDTIQGYLNPRMFAVLGFVAGCTDTLADNFDALANINDGSCTYSTTNSIYDIVSNSVDHTTLKVAIDACGLDGVLSDPNSLTLFAPTDAAFDLLPTGTVTALLADIPQLTDILKHHVVGASVLSSALSNGQVVTTLLGTDVTVTINSMGVYIDNAMVTVADITADNGVVHVIDAVLIPATTDIIDYNNLEKVYLYSVNILGEKVSKNSKDQIIFNVFQDGSVERKLIIK